MSVLATENICLVSTAGICPVSQQQRHLSCLNSRHLCICRAELLLLLGMRGRRIDICVLSNAYARSIVFILVIFVFVCGASPALTPLLQSLLSSLS